jgi:hypothetical protein
MHHGSVASGLAVEIVLFHHALKPFALRPTDHIDELPYLKRRHGDVGALGDSFTGKVELANEPFGGG